MGLEGSDGDIVGSQQGFDLAEFLRADDRGVDADLLAHRRNIRPERRFILRRHDPNESGLFVPRIASSDGITPVLEDLDRFVRESRFGDIGVVRAYQRSRLAGRSGAEIALLHDHDLAGASFGELIGGR